MEINYPHKCLTVVNNLGELQDFVMNRNKNKRVGTNKAATSISQNKKNFEKEGKVYQGVAHGTKEEKKH